MSDQERTENNVETTLYTNIADVINVESNRQSPEMTHSNITRHQSITTVNLGRFNMESPRTLRNSTSLAENISSTIEGFRPLVERVRSHPRLTSWLSIQRQRQEPPSSSVSDSYIINLDDALTNGTMVAQRSSHDNRHCQLYNRRIIDGFSSDNMDSESNDINANVNVRIEDNGNDSNSISINSGSNGNIISSSTTNNIVNNNGRSITGSEEGDNGSEENPVAESSEDLPISPETRALLIVLKRYVPYILILLVKIIYDHSIGILNLLLLLVTFVRANNDLKREIAKQQNRSWLTLGRILCQIAGCFVLVSFVFGEKIFVLYSEPVTMWELLWSVAVTDFTIKLITVALKVLLTCLPVKLLAIPKRGKFYLMVEATSQLYRCGAPIKPWLCYLFDAYQGPQRMVGVVLSIMYAISKTSDMVPRFNLFRTAVCKMLQNLSLGVVPSKEQVVASGGICAICHEEYTTPVKLRCKHIFCEACVSTWLDRERSCPLCRAAITDDPIYRDGHTTHFIQLY